METPGFNRPNSHNDHEPRPPRTMVDCRASGNQTSWPDSTCNPENLRGATPTTVTGTSSTIILLPRIAGSRLNLLFQNDQLTTATADGSPVWSSSGPIILPI